MPVSHPLQSTAHCTILEMIRAGGRHGRRGAHHSDRE
jgi:hypothetical protein